MAFRATASQLNAALHGAAYRATIVAPDVLRIRISDRAGEKGLSPPNGIAAVHITVRAVSVADIEAVVVSWDAQAVLPLWIAAATLLVLFASEAQRRYPQLHGMLRAVATPSHSQYTHLEGDGGDE